MNRTLLTNYNNQTDYESTNELYIDSTSDINLLDHKSLINLENNNSFISKKAIIDNKLNKKLNIVNDYENFYYLSEKKKGQDYIYSNININTLKNKRFPTLKLATPLSFINLKKDKKSLKENILLKFNKKDNKSAIILNSTKGGFNVFYKEMLGFISKDQILKGLKEKISYNSMLLPKQTGVISKTKISNCLMNIYFQTIKHNFSKTKRRRINFVETRFTFNNKKYEKNRKNIKTKNNR
jgi:hypothetical protein